MEKPVNSEAASRSLLIVSMIITYAMKDHYICEPLSERNHMCSLCHDHDYVTKTILQTSGNFTAEFKLNYQVFESKRLLPHTNESQ